jgi:RimJ/RimL family protein N-acetyltransferase
MFIKGKHVSFRPVSPKDAKDVFRWLNNPEITHLLFYGQQPLTMKQAERMLNEYVNDPEVVAFIIIDNKTKRPFGFAGIFDMHFTARRASIRIVIGEKKYWNIGYGLETCALLTHYGFDRLNLNAIEVGMTRADNRGAVRMYEMLGYVFCGIKRQMLYRNSRYYDCVLMDLLRDEYYKKHLKTYAEQFGVSALVPKNAKMHESLLKEIRRIKKRLYGSSKKRR